mgnify:CR=1 FL=1
MTYQGQTVFKTALETDRHKDIQKKRRATEKNITLYYRIIAQSSYIYRATHFEPTDKANNGNSYVI